MPRIENAIQTIEYFDQIMAGPNLVAKNDCIAVAKSEKILPDVINLLNAYGEKNGKGQIEQITRQRMKLGEKEIKLIRARDAANWLDEEGCDWTITSIDAVCEWATSEYGSWQELIDDYEIVGLGIGKCTVEVSCKPEFTDLIAKFKTGGLSGLKEIINQKEYRISTDLAGIARYFFPFTRIKSFGGSLELTRDPLIVGVIQTGQSLKDEGWVRLSDFNKEAVLINSQTCIMRERR